MNDQPRWRAHGEDLRVSRRELAEKVRVVVSR